jgi:uncharacterized membrane protein
MLTLLDECKNGAITVFAAAPVRGVDVSARYYYLGLAILAVLMLVAAVKAYRTWEEIHDVEEPDSPQDLLEMFEDAHAEGELDDEEFERVRRRLAASAPDSDPKPPASPPERESPENE